ncbi:stage III sporulation protein AF [Alicyclobacillus sp. ALC3]|uniref:stage III sporulation protein AF n=1 Tax=Alicyclobacillus sp. ALC3 TaxID=2796143 RepID=UPI0023791CD4|nr:stage III sporulation protein AF [Alicyclobacillus sp. ALC3]WDL97022.1 stage III sporulation protein AF [Alicyclobacillus sp. ALC3]
MTALGEWLKQLVIIVLLAAFADLLLPTRSMEKYVRMVMGLAIVAAMLQPIVPLLSRNWSGQAAATAADELLPNNATSSASGSSTGTTTTLTQEFQQQTNQAADSLLATRLRAEIVALYPVTVSSIDAHGVGLSGSQLSVHVVLGAASARTVSNIRDHLAHELDVPARQVTVTTG